MPILFFFAFVSTASIVALSVAEINPFSVKPLPMLEQIELCMTQEKYEVAYPEGLQLAA